MKILLTEPHSVAFSCHENEVVEVKSKTEQCKPACCISGSETGQEEGVLFRPISVSWAAYLHGKHSVIHTGICCAWRSFTQDVVEGADARFSILSSLAATWRLPSG